MREIMNATKAGENSETRKKERKGEEKKEWAEGKKKGGTSRDRDYESRERFRRPLSPHLAG